GRRRISGGAAMEARCGYRVNRRLDATCRVAFLEAVSEGKGYVVLTSRRRRERLRLPGFAIEDRRGLRWFLGEGFRQRQPESTWVHSGPVLRLYNVGVGGRTRIQRRAACFGAVHGVVVAFGAERPAGEGPRGNVSGHGRGSGVVLSRFGECGYGHRGNAGNGHPFAADVLRRIGHVVCFPGDWPGNECPAAPIR